MRLKDCESEAEQACGFYRKNEVNMLEEVRRGSEKKQNMISYTHAF